MPDEAPSQLYHRLVEQLRSSDVHYHELVNQLPEVVLELDLKGRLTFLNAAWFHELGYPVEESTGQSIYQFVPQEHHPPIAQILSGASPSYVMCKGLSLFLQELLRFILHYLRIILAVVTK